MVRVCSGGVRKKFSSSALSSAASSAGPRPPISATLTTASRNSTTSVDSPNRCAPLTPTAVAAAGSSTPPTQPNRLRQRGSAPRSAGSRSPPPACSWVTRCTSMGPDRCTTVAPIPWLNSRASRERRDVPSTSWVALTPWAKSSSAVGMSSPTTVWKLAPIPSASVRQRASAAGWALAKPSPRRMCSTSSSAPMRAAIRRARRTSVSLSGPPVIATTSRSLISQTSVTSCSLR